jgi:hypothetical protein
MFSLAAPGFGALDWWRPRVVDPDALTTLVALALSDSAGMAVSWRGLNTNSKESAAEYPSEVMSAHNARNDPRHHL